MLIGRRGFIGGLAALIAAPAIVRATSIMPVRAIVLPRHPLYDSEGWQELRVGFYGRSPMMAVMDDLAELDDRRYVLWVHNRIASAADKVVRPRGMWVSEVQPLENWPGMKPR